MKRKENGKKRRKRKNKIEEFNQLWQDALVNSRNLEHGGSQTFAFLTSSGECWYRCSGIILGASPFLGKQILTGDVGPLSCCGVLWAMRIVYWLDKYKLNYHYVGLFKYFDVEKKSSLLEDFSNPWTKARKPIRLQCLCQRWFTGISFTSVVLGMTQTVLRCRGGGHGESGAFV